MAKRFSIVAVLAAFALVSCAVDVPIDADVETAAPANVAAYEAAVDADFEAVMATLGTSGAGAAFYAFDQKYGTDLRSEFSEQLASSRFSSGGSSYSELTDMPFNVDGAVYLSGGGEGLVSSVIGWVAPKSLPGGYFHGAVLDLDKFDPSNLDASCLETAISKGAGYESAADWQAQVNACVLNPKITIIKAKLDAAQKAIDYYCNASTTYGFFNGYVNIFNIVTKSDNDTWYCTKTVWRVYKEYGIDVDSNSALVDFTKSGLYSLVKSYYNARYFYSSSKAKAAIADYIADARSTIVMAEEIMLSPYFSKVYEAIRAQ